MSLLSVTFSLTKEDLEIIKKEVPKVKKLSPKMILIIILILVFCGIWLFLDLAFISFNLLLVFLVPFIIINLSVFFENKNPDSKMIKRSTTFELFEDRIKITRNPDENFKGKYEKEFPLDEVAEYKEYQNFIIIVFKNYDAQFLMKKHFKKEETELLLSRIKK